MPCEVSHTNQSQRCVMSLHVHFPKELHFIHLAFANKQIFFQDNFRWLWYTNYTHIIMCIADQPLSDVAWYTHRNIYKKEQVRLNYDYNVHRHTSPSSPPVTRVSPSTWTQLKQRVEKKKEKAKWLRGRSGTVAYCAVPVESSNCCRVTANK